MSVYAHYDGSLVTSWSSIPGTSVLWRTEPQDIFSIIFPPGTFVASTVNNILAEVRRDDNSSLATPSTVTVFTHITSTSEGAGVISVTASVGEYVLVMFTVIHAGQSA